MKSILLAGAAAIVLGAAWVARPTLPGDQFQLAQSNSPQTPSAESNSMRAAPAIEQMTVERDV
jgi:hypothetical protein